jgi:hypothetical protein
MYNDKVPNTQIKILHAPGYSFLILSYFKSYLVFNFVPWLNKDDTGRNIYSKETHLSTSIKTDEAAFFCIQAARILDGKVSGEPIEAIIPCNNGTTITFEYKPDENNQMSAYLIINKNDLTIPFRFPTIEYQEKIDGQLVTTVVQTGLGIFVLILGCYITGYAANHYLDRNNEGYNEALQWYQEQG